jgi:hypothetical protein
MKNVNSVLKMANVAIEMHLNLDNPSVLARNLVESGKMILIVQP